MTERKNKFNIGRNPTRKGHFCMIYSVDILQLMTGPSPDEDSIDTGIPTLVWNIMVAARFVFSQVSVILSPSSTHGTVKMERA